MGRRDHDWLTPAVTLFAALALSVVPLPDSIAAFRPDWVAVVLLYWSLISPRRYGVFTAFWMGLMLDTLSGSLLGQHALALLLIVYVSQRFHLQMRVFPISQLAMTVIVLLSSYQFVLFWIDGIAGRTVPINERWAPVVTGTLLWFLILVFFERGRQEAESRM